MTDILDTLRAAFDGDCVPNKNIALRKAHDEITELNAKLETANALVTCCCGNPVDSHGYGDGHSPVDMYHYAHMRLTEQNEQLKARVAELERPSPMPPIEPRDGGFVVTLETGKWYTLPLSFPQPQRNDGGKACGECQVMKSCATVPAALGVLWDIER